MTLVDKIRALARQRDLSLPQLEQELGLGNGTISRWRNSSPNTEKLQKIADYFNVSMDYLLGREQFLTPKDEKDISKILDQTKQQLLSQEGLMFDGDPASPEAIITVVPKNINAISFSPLLFQEILDRHVEVVGENFKLIYFRPIIIMFPV